MNSNVDNVEGKIDSERDQYIEKQNAQVAKLNDEIEGLNSMITVADADNEAKREHKAHIEALRQTRDEARAKLMEIQEAEEDKWESLKDGIENLWSNLKYGIEKIKAKF